MSSPQDMWESIPPLTRTWLTLCLLTTTCSRFGMINPYNIVLIFPKVFQEFEIWRLATNFFFFGKFSFNFMIQMFILVSYSSRLESDPYATTRGRNFGDATDFAFCLLFCSILAIFAAWVMELYILGPVLLFSLLYLWSRRNPDTPVKLWMFPLKGYQLPWALAAFGFLMGQSPVNDLTGIFIGHIFYFLVEVLPQQRGSDIINTPSWLANLVNRALGVAYQPSVGATNSTGNHNWGPAGQRLGGN